MNTAPEKTIDAVADHGVIRGDTITGTYAAASATFTALEALGIDLTDVFEVLETEGVEKFEQAWTELLESVEPGTGQEASRRADRTSEGRPRHCRCRRHSTAPAAGHPIRSAGGRTSTGLPWFRLSTNRVVNPLRDPRDKRLPRIAGPVRAS